MKHPSLHSWHTQSLHEAEARLCYDQKEVPRPQVTVTPPQQETPLTLMTRSLPLLGSAMNYLFPSRESIDVKTQENMADHAQWVDAFQGVTLAMLTTDKPDPNVDRSKIVTPKEAFAAMTPKQRREVFFEYIDFYIRPMKEWDKVTGQSIRSLEKRATTLGDTGLKVCSRSLLGILGLDGLSTDNDKGARALAQGALDEHFQKGLLPGTINKSLDDHYAEALQWNGLKPQEPFATMPIELQKPLPPSAFKGALRLGVIGTKTLKTLNTTLLNLQQDRDSVTAKTSTSLDEMAGVTEKRLREEAKTIPQIWNSMGGFEKLAVIAVCGYGLMNEWVRNIAMLLGGGYLFQRFILKEKDPLKTWSKTINANVSTIGGTDFMQGVKKFVGFRTENDVVDPGARADVVVKFLDKLDRRNIETQAKGLAIMLELPLDVLARNFHKEKDGTYRLNLTEDGTVDDALQNVDPAYRPAFEAFFEEQANQEMASEAMTYVFYRKGAEDPNYARDVDLVEKVLGRMPSGSLYTLGRVDKRVPGGSSPAKLADPTVAVPSRGGKPPIPTLGSSDPAFQAEIDLAGQAFTRLVEHGRERALHDGTSLRTFMQTTMDLKAVTFTQPKKPDNVAGTAKEENAATVTEEEVKKLEEEEAAKAKEEEAKKVKEEEAAKAKEEEAKKVEEEKAAKAKEEEAKKVKEEEARKVKEEEAKKVQEEEARKVKEEEAKKVQEEEAKRVREEEAKRVAEEVAGKANAPKKMP